MNDPTDIAINVDDMIAWLDDYKARTGKSWTQIARLSNIPYGTITNFGGGSYKGDYAAIAKKVFAFKQKIDSQDQRVHTLLAEPTYVETPTSRRVMLMLELALMGRMVIAAMGPGTGKSMTAKHFRNCMGASVYLVTLRETTGELLPMLRQVLRTMRIKPQGTNKAAFSEQIMDHIRGSKALIIFDEANFLTLKAIEEIRAWRDETGVGVALLGNEELEERIRGQRLSHQYGRLARRIRRVYVQDLLGEDDIAAFLDANDIDDPRSRRLLTQIGTAPGEGGLGGVQMVLEDAHLLAIGEDKAVEFEHIAAASGSRVTKILRRAA